MSFDDTPEVPWSAAWWSKWIAGICLPVLFVGFSICALVTGHAYAVGILRYHIRLVPVFGFSAVLMAIAYFAAAVFGFARYYLRWHRTGSLYYPALEAGSIVALAISIGWCAFRILQGY